MNAITKTAIKAYLSQQPPERLMADLLELFTKFPAVQAYYQAKLSPIDDARLVEKYKAMISREFFADGEGGQARRAAARKAIAEYKSVSGDPAGLADLMLFFVETGVEHAKTYGEMGESFYNGLASMFYKALQHLAKHGLQAQFDERCRKITRDAAGCHWGFQETLTELYDRVTQAT